MSDKKKLVAQTYFEVSDVKHQPITEPLDYSKDVFTYLKNTFTADGMRPISLNTLEQLINDYSNAKGGKIADRCILKGIYKDGYNGVNCAENVPYLFFDIDVKKEENPHLLADTTNKIIFEELQKVAVLVWRSKSGTGMAGVLYAPQVAKYLNDNKDLHLLAGKAVTNYLSDYLHQKTGIQRIKFDQAQSKLRQVRFLAEQKNFRPLNPAPFEFTYKSEQKVKKLSEKITAYRFKDYRTPYGDIFHQFNSDNDILKIAKECGFDDVSHSENKVRLKHPDSTSATSGEIDTGLNIYFNYSESIAKNKEAFTPSKMLCRFKFNNNWSDFKKHLIGLGYKEKRKPQDEVKQTSAILKKELANLKDKSEADKIIFSYCYDLQTLEPQDKAKFINTTCADPDFIPLFKAYLNLPDYEIKFDEHLTIKKYVAEVLTEVLDYADKHKKVVLRAETGKGKTTAFIRDFHTHRPNARILVLVPLTVILKQNEKEYKGKAVFIDGTNAKYQIKNIETENFVFATYEQGIKILQVSAFDYVIVDEIHQLLTANSFKRSVIAEITPLLEQNIIIGLTGTPTAIFKEIGYNLINVDVKAPQKTGVEVRYSNIKTFDIALSHIRNVKGKTLIRLNDIKGIEILKTQLVLTKLYKETEILVLYSKEQIKSSQDYKILAHERRFDDKIKLVLTTSLIDEGLSINQTGFTDVVFIETSYSPRPEPIKQFFARFRNADPQRKNYLYLRTKNDQRAGRFNPVWAYNDTHRALSLELDELGDNEAISTYNGLFSNDPFFYNNNTANLFYLGYSITDTLFRSLNTVQFRDYLETNFNLQLAVNDAYEVLKSFSVESHARKEIKKQVAGVWINQNKQALQVLALHTLDNAIRSKLTIEQIEIAPEIESFVISEIKDFEKLYRNGEKIKKLGVDDPNTILIKKDLKTMAVTLSSSTHIKNEITLLKLEKTIKEPINQADIYEGERFLKFAEWCREKKDFTSSQMFRELKKLGVRKNSAFNEKMIFIVLEWFGINAKRDREYNIIKCR